MKKMLLMLVCLCMLSVAGTASALPLYTGSTDSTLGSGTTALPAAPYDAGYYIWSNDSERFNWSIRWTNDSSTVATFFGKISYGYDLTSQSILFETTGTYADKMNVSTDGLIKWKAYASSGWDGIDFILDPTSVRGNTLQFMLGSSLFSAMVVSTNHVAGSNIFIGDGRSIPTVQVQSLQVSGLNDTISGIAQGFEVPAPVPEPGTMVLLGFGMLGLAIYGKRRMNKEA